MQEIIQVLRRLICENFADDTIDIAEDTVLCEIAEWDSIELINIISMIEEKYGFRFNVSELTDMSNVRTVGEMADIIVKKLV